jgi:hypothetical protein
MSKVKTEDTGKIFEMAICLACKTPYNGKFNYSLEDAQKLSEQLTQLPELFPNAIHTAEKGARYDFTNDNGHLSAKTIKKSGGKVAPQVIGQPHPMKFCSVIGIDYIDIPTLKHYIQANPANVLKFMSEYTFDCPNVFYVKKTASVRWIALETPIDWTQYTYIWTRSADKWTNSTTLKINNEGSFDSIAEFQFHSTRKNMAIRWSYENFLRIFRKNLRILVL